MTPSANDLSEFKAFVQRYDQPQGRDWYSHEISNIASAFAGSKGYGGDSQYIGSLAGMAYPGKYFQQAPADLFPEGQDNGDGFGGGLLGLAALGAGAYFGMPSFSDFFSGLGAAGAGEAAAGSMLFPGEAVIGSSLSPYTGFMPALSSALSNIPPGASQLFRGLTSADGSSDLPAWGVNQIGGGGMFDPLADFGSSYFDTPNLGYDMTGLEGMSSYDANGNLINLNPLEQLYSSIQNIPNFPGRDTLIKSLLSQAVGGSGSSALGNLFGAGLGMYGSNQQAKSLMNIANQARADRQPYLNASLNYLGNPDAYFAGPGKAAMDATLKGLSTKVGNPIGSPTAMGIATEAGLQDWRNAVTGFGNMGLAGQDLRANLQSSAAQANANGLNALGYGLNSVLNPQPNITDIVKAMNMGGLA